MLSRKVLDTIREILGRVIPEFYQSPVEWAESHINFKEDLTAFQDDFDLTLTPYLRAIIEYWEFQGKIRECTVVAPEQTGKTLSWLIPLLWSMEYIPCLSLVCYPSDEKGEQINSQKMQPLMRQIPSLANELRLPRSYRKNSYNFSNLKSFFMGAGSRVTSVSAKIRIADETDDWVIHEGQVANIQDLRKRARSFSESMFAKVCSPTSRKNTIWREFKQSSQGFWHLRCQGCGELTLRSADIHNLQWAMDSEKIVLDSLRLVCPECRKEHKEKQKRKMNINGGFIHVKPDIFPFHAGFQWGALASQLKSLCWENIARAQLSAGRSGGIEEQIYFDNSIRGLPFTPRKATDSQLTAIKKHRIEKYPEIKFRMMGCDVQDDSVYWVVRGYDLKENSFLLKNGRARSWEEMEEIWKDAYFGGRLNAGIMDVGGHRSREVWMFLQNKQGFFGYKGNSKIGARWKQSKENKQLILANPKVYQAELLYYIYSAEQRGNNYWYLPEDVTDGYIQQIASLKPDNNKKFGDEYENWVAGKNDHYFDCEKELLVLKEIVWKLVRRKKPNSKKRKPKVSVI